MIPSQTRKKPSIHVVGMITFLFLILSAANVWAKPRWDASLRWTIPIYTPTTTPRTGGLCVEVYHDRNRDGVRQATSEELLAGAVVHVANAAESQVIATATTLGGERPCFTALEPALYLVRKQNPPGYISTTDNAWGAVITSNVTIAVPFGDVLELSEGRRPYLPLIMRNLQSSTAAPVRAADPSTGDISVVSWRDDNGNKAIDAGEPPVASTATSMLTSTPTPTTYTLRREVVFQHQVSGNPSCEWEGCYQTTEDTYLDSWQPDTNTSSEGVMRLRATGTQQISAPLFKFDLFRIPTEATVISATLSLHLRSATAQNTEVAVFKMLRPWTAKLATWRKADAVTFWQAPGANGIGSDREGSPVWPTPTTLRGAGLWYDFNVTDVVRAWVANPGANHGLLLRSVDQTSSGYRYEFTSSEGAEQFRPKLTVAYEAPPTQLEDRFGVGFSSSFCGDTRVRRRIWDYDWDLLRIGWYSDWDFTPSWTTWQPYLPQGTEYVQLIDVSDNLWNRLNWTLVRTALTRTPGMIWIIGNEPEDPSHLTPAQYAERYDVAYTFIKHYDPTALVAIGGVVQPTKLRQIWLERMSAEYAARHDGATVPVDFWNIHVQILTEQRATDWPIPVGLDWETVRREGRNFSTYENAGIATFISLITEFRQWLKEQGYQDKPLMISEYGVLYSAADLHEWGSMDYGQKVLEEYMTLTFDYLLQAQDRNIGYPGDDYRLVQRWLWFSLNINPPDYTRRCGYSGALFDWTDASYPGTLTKTGLRYLRYMQALDRESQEGIAATTNTGTDITTLPTVRLTIRADDMSKVNQIAVSANPGAFHVRQTKNQANEPVPDKNNSPLVLTQTRFVAAPPAGNEATISWDVTDATYGGSAGEGSKTIYARLKYKDGTWSRMYLTTVRYLLNVPTATPTPTNTQTPTATRTPTVTPTGYVAPTQTHTATPTLPVVPTPLPTWTPTPTTGYLCVRVYHDRNGDLAYQPGTEELLGGARLEVLDTQFQAVRRYTTDGSSEPFCMGDLTAGNYYVREDDPPGYVSEVRYFSVSVVANRRAVLSIGDHLASSAQ